MSWLEAIELWEVAAYFRTSRWGYAALNTVHITGIGMLFGAILPLDLRLLGCWPGIDRRLLARVLVPMAATGLITAVASGSLLFSVRAQEYSGLPVFQIKLAVIASGAVWAIATHMRYGLWLDRNTHSNPAMAGAVSLILWMSAVICGRLIAFFN